MTPPLEGDLQGSEPYRSGHSDPEEPASLQALLDRWGSLPLGASLVVYDDLLATLDGPAASGPRDLTARSVVVDGSGHVRRGATLLSPAYGAGAGSSASTAPELRTGAARTLASDVYAASALFIEAATGLLPQAGGRDDGPGGGAGPASPVPEAVMAVARQGLAADPGARPSPGLLRARVGIAGDAALHEWQNRGRTWLSSAVATLRPTPDVIPPKIDWSAYGPRPGSEPEATGFVGLRAPRALTGFGIAFTGLLMTIIGTCNIGSAPPQAGVSAATQQPAAITSPAPAATTDPGFAVPSTPSAPDAGQATVGPSPSSAAAPTAVPTALPSIDPNAFTPFPVPTDVPTPPSAPTPTPGNNCLLFC